MSEVVECRAQLVVAGDLGSDVVVTAVQILHEGADRREARRRQDGRRHRRREGRAAYRRS